MYEIVQHPGEFQREDVLGRRAGSRSGSAYRNTAGSWSSCRWSCRRCRSAPARWQSLRPAAAGPGARLLRAGCWPASRPQRAESTACFSPSATLMAASRVPVEFGHHRAADALGRHLAVHRFLHLAGRDDLADFDVGHLHAPALGDLVQPGAQHVVDVLAFGKHIIQEDAADDRAQRGGRHTLGSRLRNCRPAARSRSGPALCSTTGNRWRSGRYLW